MSSVIQPFLIFSLSAVYALQTQFYGGPGGFPDPFEYLNQGRISGVNSWGSDSSFRALIIKDMSSDQPTKSFPEMGSYSISTSCSSFTLQSNEYIDGYRVKWRDSGQFELVTFLGFHTSNGNTHQCQRGDFTSDTGWIYPSNVYLIGISTKAASVIDSVSLQFAPIPTTSPTPSPTNIPTYIPTIIPTNIPTNIPTFYPTQNPTNIPTIEPTYIPTFMPITNLPTTSIPTTTIPTSVPTSTPITSAPIPAPTFSPVTDGEVGTTELFEPIQKKHDPDKPPVLILGMEPWRVYIIFAALALICILLIIITCCKCYKMKLNKTKLNIEQTNKNMISITKTPGESTVELPQQQNTNTLSTTMPLAPTVNIATAGNVDGPGNCIEDASSESENELMGVTTNGNVDTGGNFIEDVSSDSESELVGVTTNGNTNNYTNNNTNEVDVGSLEDMYDNINIPTKYNEAQNIYIKNDAYKSMDITQYYQWNSNDILIWILSLDNGRYLKYENVLRKSLMEEGVCGEDLNEVDVTDIKGWGVVAFKDKKHLYKRMKELTSQYQEDDEELYEYDNHASITKAATANAAHIHGGHDV